MVVAAACCFIVALLMGALTTMAFHEKSFGLAVVAGMVCVALSIISATMFYNDGINTGHDGTPLTKRDLKTSTLYETVGSPVIQRAMTINNTPEYLVFLKTEAEVPKAYCLEISPPSRFVVIRNEQGQLEFLPRPLPEEQPSPGQVKQPAGKAPEDTKVKAVPGDLP